MKQSTRALTAGIAAAVAFGFAAPAAVAAPPAGHAKPAHSKSADDKPAHDKVSAKLAQQLRQVVRDIAHKDAALVRVVRESRSSRLSADAKSAVSTNVTADRAALDGLRAAVEAADSALDLRQVRTDLRDVRPSVYQSVINGLWRADRIAAGALANETALAELAAEGAETTAAVVTNEAVTTAVAAARELGFAITATSPKAEQRAFQRALVAAQQALGAAKDAIEALQAPVEAPVDPEVPVDDPETPIENPITGPVTEPGTVV